MAIYRILICDECHRPAGARPAFTGTEARRVRYAGSIRRYLIGQAAFSTSSRRHPINRDLCADCRQHIAVIQARVAHAWEAHADATFEPAVLR